MKKLCVEKIRRIAGTIMSAAALTIAAHTALAQRPLGVDVSSYQGHPNWTTIRNSGIQFAWAKATEGTGVIDADFTYNMPNGKAAGVYMGGYHFAHPELNSPGSEATYFWNEAGGYINADGQSFMPMLDMEVFSGVVGASSYSDWVNQWCNSDVASAAAKGVHVQPFIYMSACNGSFFNSSISQWLSDIANYNGESTQTGTPWNVCSGDDAWGGGNWNVWQYTDTAISGDGDVFNGNTASMISLGVPRSPHVPIDSYAGDNSVVENIQIFVPDAVNNMESDWQNCANCGWVGWSAFGGPTVFGDPVSVGYNADGRVQVFVRGSDNNMWTTWKTNVNGGGWYAWQNYGGPINGDVTVGYLPNGAMQVFARSSSNTVMTMWQTGPNGGWTAWSDMGGACYADPVVGANADGRMQLFCQSSTHTMQSNWKTTSGSWNGWSDYGGNCYGKPAVGNLEDGTMQVFVHTSSNTVGTIFQTCPNCGWGSWSDMGGSCFADPILGYNADDRLQLFIQTSTHTVSSDYKLTTAVGSAWSGWGDHGGSWYIQFTVGYNADGRMQLFMRDANYVMWSQWQTNVNGGWNTWQNYGGNTPSVSITTQPSSQTINAGQNVTFSVVASGVLNYQWKFNGGNISGATNSSYTINNAQTSNAGTYAVVTANRAFSVTSSNATLTVNGGPPAITTQPANATVNQGQNATFSVVATGSAPLAYQWEFNGANISGATASSYTVVSAQSANAGTYAVVVTNSLGSATSANATLTVNIPPSITTQPANQTVTQGQAASFSVVAAGTTPLSYQWQFGGANISGATTSGYSISSAQPANAGNYDVVVTNVAGAVTSATATLTVNVPPSITTQPANATVTQGQNATFSVVAAGTTPLSYQWTFNGGNISGATASSYTVVNAQPANAGTYAVTVTNVAGTVASANASLTVNVPPSITTQPSSETVTQGQPASFSVVATGTAPLSYQWQLGGANISGATASSYSIASAQPANAGNYDVIVNNVAGSVTSATATLTVNVPPSITTQPANQTVNQGQNATFSVVAAGTTPLSYQWTFNGANITGATASSLTITNAQAGNAGTYAVAITNVAGTVTSGNATLTVILPPIISTQPASQLAAVSNSATFTVGLSQGSTPLSYQWKKNGANISGATLSSLTLSSLTWGSAGTYSVTITNVAGSATSANATLTMEQAAFTLVNGFESYNLGVLDQNQSGGPNTGLSNPWWGPGPPNITVFTNQGGVAPHSGSKMIGASPNVQFCQEYLNMPYRLDSGSNYFGNIMLDWWFYDPKGTGTGASNYGDYFALAEYLPVSTTNDFTTTTFTTYNQRVSLGAYVGTGQNLGFYQGRIPGATGGFNTNGWFNTSTARSVGWHHARIVVGIPTNNSGPISMFIDNMTNATLSYSTSGENVGFNLIEINSSFGGINTGGYFDDMTFQAANDPWVAQPPTSLTVTAGSNANFATVAVGTSFQWQFNGANISGATTTSYTVTNAQTNNAGSYSCVITGANGTTSTSATLTVH
jgi:GH25 family lysozyme M1 (1,4-beta-N-acetylmuramidase)